MCGRFTLSTPADLLEALFDMEDGDWGEARYNIAPQSQIVTVEASSGRRRTRSRLWGVASTHGPRLVINARSETVQGSPLFAHAFATSRVLVPADGFFEWTQTGRERRARLFHQPARRPFAFAGIVVAPPRGSAEQGRGVVLLTTEASPSVRAYHDRMPVRVPQSAFADWLDRETPPRQMESMLKGAAEVSWESYAVGPRVNNVHNDDPRNIEPFAPGAPAQGSLF